MHSCYKICHSFYPKGHFTTNLSSQYVSAFRQFSHTHILPPPPASEYSWAIRALVSLQQAHTAASISGSHDSHTARGNPARPHDGSI